MTAEQEVLDRDNAQVIKENEKYEVDNEKLNKNIVELIQRIDVSTLLKEIDMEEMRHLANQNIQTNQAFENLLWKWSQIKTQENDI